MSEQPLLSPHDTEIVQFLQEAMTQDTAISFVYDNEERVVEVHAIGVSNAGNAVFRGYQVFGGSVSGEDKGWKLFRVSKVGRTATGYHFPKSVSIRSMAPREGYQKGDKGMSFIFKEL